MKLTKSLPKIEINMDIDGVTHLRTLNEDLVVDEAHINDYLIDAPGKVAYWNNLYEVQKTRVQRSKVAVQRIKAQIDLEVREKASAEGRKITAAEVESRVITNKEYQDAEDRLLEMQEQMNILQGAVEALKEMRSTLISLSANMRQSGTMNFKKVYDIQKRYEDDDDEDKQEENKTLQKLREQYG